MISQTTPAGIRIGPISGPRTQAGLKTKPFNPEPYFKGQQMAINATIRKDKQLAAQEKAQLDFLKEQNEQFKNIAGSAGKSELISGSGIDVDPLTLKGRGALTKFNEYQSKMQQEMYSETAKATDGTGKLDQITAGRNVGIIQQKYQDLILNDPDIIEASIISRDRQQFIDNVNKLEKDGYFVSPRAKREALEAADNYLNDGTGELSYDKSIFNTEGMSYREKEMEAATMQLIGDAVGETDFERLVSAASLGGGYRAGDGLLSENVTVQNERKRAIEISVNRLEKSPRMKSFIQDRYNMDPQTYLETRIDALLNEDDKREIVTSITGLSSVSSGRREREKSEADQTRKETVNNYGIEGNSQPDKELRTMMETLVGMGAQRLPDRNQAKRAKDAMARYNKNREEGSPAMLEKHMQLDESGNFVIRMPTEDGSLGEVYDEFGSPKGVIPKISSIPDLNLSGESIFIESESLGYGNNSITKGGEGDLGFRNKNPLNIRPTSSEMKAGTKQADGTVVMADGSIAVPDGKGMYFYKFPTFEAGMEKAMVDIRYKTSGRSPALRANMSARGRDGEEPTVADLIETWSPRYSTVIGGKSGDNPDNVVDNYITYVGTSLGIDPMTTPLSYFKGKEDKLALVQASMESPDSFITMVKQRNGELQDNPTTEKASGLLDESEQAEIDQGEKADRQTRTTATEASAHTKRDGTTTTEQTVLEEEVLDYLEKDRNVDAMIASTKSPMVKSKLERYKKAKEELAKAPKRGKQKWRDELSRATEILADPEVYNDYVGRTLSDAEKNTAFEVTMTTLLNKMRKGEAFQYDIEYRKASSGMGGTAPRGELKNATLYIGQDDDGLFAEFDVGLGEKLVEASDMATLVKRIRYKIPFMKFSSDIIDTAFQNKLEGITTDDTTSDTQDNAQTNTPEIELNTEDVVNTILEKVNEGLTSGTFTREMAMDYITGKNKDGAIDGILEGLTPKEVEVVKKAKTQNGFDTL